MRLAQNATILYGWSDAYIGNTIANLANRICAIIKINFNRIDPKSGMLQRSKRDIGGWKADGAPTGVAPDDGTGNRPIMAKHRSRGFRCACLQGRTDEEEELDALIALGGDSSTVTDVSTRRWPSSGAAGRSRSWRGPTR